MDNKIDPYAEWLGIQDKQRPLTNYQLLGLAPFAAEADAIESHAQQQLAKLAQFSKGEHGIRAKRIAFEIESAKTCLLDPLKKAAYDANLQSREHPTANRPPAHLAVTRPPEPPDKAAAPQPFEKKPEFTNSLPNPSEENTYAFAPIDPPIRSASWLTKDISDSFEELPLHHRSSKNNQWLLPVTIVGCTFLVVAVTIAFTSGQRGKNAADARTDRNPVSSETTPVTRPNVQKPTQPASRDNRPAVAVPQPNQSILQQVPRIINGARQTATVQRPQIFNAKSVATIRPPRRVGQTKPTAETSRKSANRHDINLQLPSGAALTEAMLTIPPQWQNTLFPQNSIVYVTKYPNGSPHAGFSLKNAKLDGAMAVLHEAGKLQVLEVYSKGERNGALRQWSETGDRFLYADYKYGKKFGLVCIFQEGLPWLIQEWDKGNLQNEYLVQWNAAGPRLVNGKDVSGDEKKEYRSACDKLSEVLKEADQNEKAWKREAADWYHKEDLRLRQERVLANAADEKARRQTRSAVRARQMAVANQQAWQNVLRSSMPRTGLNYGP